MTTADVIIDWCCRIDDAMTDLQKHSPAILSASEIVTLAIVFAIKGVGNRACDRCLQRHWRHRFPSRPHRPRWLRWFKRHRQCANHVLAAATVLGVIDRYGLEFIPRIREGRSPRQMGPQGQSNQRWIVGGQ
jgi:hypothetical protein